MDGDYNSLAYYYVLLENKLENTTYLYACYYMLYNATRIFNMCYVFN